MNRRHFLQLSSGAAVAGFSGCIANSDASSSEAQTGEDGEATDEANPWGKGTLTVGLEQHVSARHDIQEIIEESLSYWEENSSIYAGYPISYKYRPNSDDPDIKILLVDAITDCGEHSGGEVAGCAPLVRTGRPESAEVRIVDGYRYEWMLTTLIHEIGHTLGLDHDAEPAHIMSNQIEDRIPDYNQRREAIETYSDSSKDYAEAMGDWSDAMDAWNEQEFSATSRLASNALEHLEMTLEKVSSAKSIADDLGEDEAYELLTESSQHVNYLIQAVEQAIKMADEAEAENYDQSDAHREESNRLREKATTYEFDNYDDVVVAFGFPEPESE